MITDIYYFLSVFVLFNQLKWIISPKVMMNEIDTTNILQNKDFDPKLSGRYSDEYKSVIKRSFSSILIIGWLFLGFFTEQWILFMFLSIFQFFIIHPISKLIKSYQKPYIFFHWFNSLIGFLSISFIVINQYKLHIDFATPFMIFIVEFFRSIF